MFVPTTKKNVFEQSLLWLTIIFSRIATIATEIDFLISRVEPNRYFTLASVAFQSFFINFYDMMRKAIYIKLLLVCLFVYSNAIFFVIKSVLKSLFFVKMTFLGILWFNFYILLLYFFLLIDPIPKGLYLLALLID